MSWICECQGQNNDDDSVCGDCGRRRETHPEALATYEEVLKEFASDGVLDEAEQLELAALRADLGVSLADHQALVARYAPQNQALAVSLAVDEATLTGYFAGRSGFVRVQTRNDGDRILCNVVVRYAVSGEGAMREHGARLLRQDAPDEFGATIELPRPGQYMLEFVVRAEDVLGKTRQAYRAEPVGFAVAEAAATAGPSTLVVNTTVEAGSMRAAADSLAAVNIAAPMMARQASGALSERAYRVLRLRPVSTDEWDDWAVKRDAGARARRDAEEREATEAKARAAIEAKARAEAEAREAAETKARAEAAVREAAQAQAKAEADAKARAKAAAREAAEAQAQAEAEERAQKRAQAKAKREAEERAEREEEERRQQAEAEERARKRAETQAKANTKQEAERRAREQQDVETRKAALKLARKLQPWMDDNGEDDHGVWADAKIGGVVVKFRFCPPGHFMMGSATGETGRSTDEGPQHEVELTGGFWMAEAPVTQRLWKAVTGDEPSRFTGPDRPVEQVTWGDCLAFMAKANELNAALALRFPTEAEWEYACGAGTTTPNYLGKNDAQTLTQIAWCEENSGKETHPVKMKAPNAWGLYDMLGNVWEWCSDWSGDYEAGLQVDPQGPQSGTQRVRRGGSWSFSARCAYRNSRDLGSKVDVLGFRLVRSAGSSTAGLPLYGNAVELRYPKKLAELRAEKNVQYGLHGEEQVWAIADAIPSGLMGWAFANGLAITAASWSEPLKKLFLVFSKHGCVQRYRVVEIDGVAAADTEFQAVKCFATHLVPMAANKWLLVSSGADLTPHLTGRRHWVRTTSSGLPTAKVRESFWDAKGIVFTAHASGDRWGIVGGTSKTAYAQKTNADLAWKEVW